MLEVTVTNDGKEAMAEKFVAIQSAVATSDFENIHARFALSACALISALSGVTSGEMVRRQYEQIIEQKFNENTICPPNRAY